MQDTCRHTEMNEAAAKLRFAARSNGLRNKGQHKRLPVAAVKLHFSENLIKIGVVGMCGPLSSASGMLQTWDDIDSDHDEKGRYRRKL